jgi:hypothetical protein
MEADIDNSRTSAILSDLGANSRTIGVLTKPDRLPADHDGHTWRDVLEGKAFPQGHGYFAVKQLAQQNLKNGTPHTEARVMERSYFDSPAWTARFAGFEDQCGTLKLQGALSHKLAALISSW